MFKSDVYKKRREDLHKKMKTGMALFIGNNESPMNYPSNTYHFRQDSDFLYFFGLDVPGLAAVMDFDAGKDRIFGNDLSMDDIIWMGPQPSVRELAFLCGVTETGSVSDLEGIVKVALSKKRKIHFLPPYRGDTKINIGNLFLKNPCNLETLASSELITAVVAMRSIKEKVEIEEIEKAVDIACDMHVSAMRMCKEGTKEQEIFGKMEGIALSKGAGPSFPIILSINGQTLHNHLHSNNLKKGRLVLADAGAETNMHYASDITRTTPVGGKFSQQQKEIYEIVLRANTNSVKAVKPGFSNLELHFIACKIIADGLKELGLMKGDTEMAVHEGAHALFMPHGIGHMMGLDVHDMESLGENFVGYDKETIRSSQFGLAFLRFAVKYKPGHVFTIEPGCYFIPELINLWKSEGKFRDFINYEKIEKYMSIGGIRIEDNVIVTDRSSRVLGKPIPKTIKEIESVCM
jgi:Xaa-Pro aminopeptidase